MVAVDLRATITVKIAIDKSAALSERCIVQYGRSEIDRCLLKVPSCLLCQVKIIAQDFDGQTRGLGNSREDFFFGKFQFSQQKRVVLNGGFGILISVSCLSIEP